MRKIGVGFNHTRVLGCGPEDWRKTYDLMRRIVRFKRPDRGFDWYWTQRFEAAGLVEMLRVYRRDAK